jgi:hypothetical protein
MSSPKAGFCSARDVPPRRVTGEMDYREGGYLCTEGFWLRMPPGRRFRWAALTLPSHGPTLRGQDRRDGASVAHAIKERRRELPQKATLKEALRVGA